MRVGLISLGCAKNLVDAEIMLGSLLKDGVEVVNDAAGADAVIVNTCSFIDAAQEESVDAILESAQVREARNRGQALIVSGCLPQRFRDELPRLLPEVDAFMGIDQVAQVTGIVRQALERRATKMGAAGPPKPRKRNAKSIVAATLAAVDREKPALDQDVEESIRGTRRFGRTRTVLAVAGRPAGAPRAVGPAASAPAAALEVNRRPTYVPDYATPRFRLTPRHFAYLKIAEGCNHPCSFCIIPRMRGAHRSRPLADVVAEARRLIADGARELNLISQDSTYYGLDLRPDRAGSIAAPDRFREATRSLPAGTPTLSALLRELNALPGDFWIRLLYTHPAHWTDELIETIGACPKVARYVDMPLQHIHENMLERMRRETSREYIVNLIRRIRAGIPGIAIRTTFIVGFPGETDACFRALIDFIREARFERLGVFLYSREEGTRAAKMENQVADRVKRRRRDAAMAEQLTVARQVSESFVGRTIRVLVEKEAKDLAHARLFSWEHGLLRGSVPSLSAPGARRFSVARGEADAPDIDGRVYVRGLLPVGAFARVTIVGHSDYDLIAEPA